MTFFSRHKKIILCAAILLVVMVGFWIGADTAEAQGKVSAGFKAVASKLNDLSIGIAMVYGVLYFLSLLLKLLLAIAGVLLNFAYTMNMFTLPTNMLIVQQGWTILRDLVNGLFILIIVWIAFTIIFNLEGLGGKKLLVRVIIIGLLINFSLTMVTGVFGFTNQLARVFAQPLGLDPYVASKNPDIAKNGISGYIIQNSGIHTVDKMVNQGELNTFKQQVEQASQQHGGQNPQQIQEGFTQQWFAGLWQSINPPQPIPTAEAQSGSTIATGALAAACIGTVGIVTSPTTVGAIAAAAGATPICITGAATVVQVLASLLGFQGPIEEAVLIAVNLATGNIFLGLTALAMFAAAILLIMRIIAMIFISVFAPIAFAAYMMPVRYGERIWGMWLDNLFRWAFVAPIFYFLLYLSLLMLQVAAVARSGVSSIPLIPFTGNIFYIFSLIIFLVFLWASIFLTRKAAGMGAEAALSFGKKLGGLTLGLATGGAALGARWGARQLTPQLQKIMGAPLLRQTTIARRTGAYLERQKNLITPHERELEGFSDDYLTQEYERSFRAERKVAIANLLAKRGELGKLRGEQAGALNLAAQFGPASALNILKARPDLATPEVLNKIGMKNTDGTEFTPEQAFAAVIKKIGTGDAANISNEVFAKDPATGRYNNEGAIKALWQELRPEHIQQIARNKPATASAMMEYLNASPQTVKDIKPEMYTYLSSNASQGIGLRLPATHEKPQAIMEQDIRAIAAEVVAEQAKYAEQESRADRHARAGNAPDEARARVDMQIIKDKLDVLNNKIDAMEEELRDNGVKVLSLQKNPLSVATEDRLYAGDILPVGGTGPYQVEILEGGPLPRGLEFNQPTGRIVGTPTAAAVGKHRLVIRIKDSAGAQSVPRPIVLEIKPK